MRYFHMVDTDYTNEPLNINSYDRLNTLYNAFKYLKKNISKLPHVESRQNVYYKYHEFKLYINRLFYHIIRDYGNTKFRNVLPRNIHFQTQLLFIEKICYLLPAQFIDNRDNLDNINININGTIIIWTGTDNRQIYIDKRRNSLLEEWTINGLHHRYYDKPAYISEESDGLIFDYRWYQLELLHRLNDLPAVIQTNGNTIMHLWYIENQLFRANDKPDTIEYYNNGINSTIFYEKWHDINGRLHRDIKPAVIKYDINGRKIAKIWYTNGMINRTNNKYSYFVVNPDNTKEYRWYKNNVIYRNNDKPAKVILYNDDRVKIQIWYNINGLKHRENDLPAVMEYNNDGRVKATLWYINGHIHRENDEPALIEILDNGDTHLMWFNHNINYRQNDSPSDIVFNSMGERHTWTDINGQYIREEIIQN